MKLKLQFGITSLLCTATLFAVLANWRGLHIDRARDVERAVDMLGGLSSFDHHDILDEQYPNPQKIIELGDHMQALGNDASAEVIQKFCDKFPIQTLKHGNSRTTVLVSLVQTFWSSGDSRTPRPHWYYSGVRSRSVKFKGEGDRRYTLVDEPWPMPSEIIVVDGIPFDRMFYSRILGPYLSLIHI